MQANFIDAQTQTIRRFGEIYSDRNIRLAGEARYLSGSSQVETRGLRLISTPANGGAEAITIIPNGIYPLPATDSSIWVQIQRTAGTSTAVLGTTMLAVAAGAQSKPLENWVQLFYRSSVIGEIIAYGSFLVGLAPNWTRMGITRANSIYDAIVGQNPADPNITHTDIQTAINDCVDGNRILVMEGTYNITTATGYSATSALSWSGKTLTIEGEGYKTIIRNAGAFTRAFSIQSSDSVFTGSSGSGSRVISLQIQAFNQSIQFDGGAGFGLRNSDINIWMSDFVTASYVAPACIGTGTSEQNTVHEKAISTTGVLQDKFVIASGVVASNISRIESSGTLTYNELVDFQRPTSGYGILPLGSVLATFPSLTGAYVCSATTVADARGFVQCNGQTIADATSPMNGAVIPNINNNIFLAGNVTSGLTGGANSLNTTVPASGFSVSGNTLGAKADWNSATIAVTGTGSFLRGEMNTGQTAHDHILTTGQGVLPEWGLSSGRADMLTVPGGNTISFRTSQTTDGWNATGYGTYTGPATAFVGIQRWGVELYGRTAGTRVNWDPSGLNSVTVNFSGSNINKSSWNSDQNNHQHGFSAGVVGTSTANTWDNRPQFLSSRYVMRIK